MQTFVIRSSGRECSFHVSYSVFDTIDVNAHRRKVNQRPSETQPVKMRCPGRMAIWKFCLQLLAPIFTSPTVGTSGWQSKAVLPRVGLLSIVQTIPRCSNRVSILKLLEKWKWNEKHFCTNHWHEISVSHWLPKVKSLSRIRLSSFSFLCDTLLQEIRNIDVFYWFGRVNIRYENL